MLAHTLERRLNGTDVHNVLNNPYGYQPTAWICAIFVALYSLITIAHLGQAIWTKKWYLLGSVVLCGISELIGWGARLWSSQNINVLTPFLMQISTTIFAPTFTAAANFIILGTIINRVGAQYSRLPAPLYGIIFVTIDVAALIVQAIGGGMAASAAENETPSGPSQAARGGHIMLGGIVVQLVEIIVSFILAAEFFFNYAKGKAVRSPSVLSKDKHTWLDRITGDRPPPGDSSDRDLSEKPSNDNLEIRVDEHQEGGFPARRMTRKLRLMSFGLGFSTLCLLIRSIYRTIELSNGWGGRIITTEVYFNVLDGMMVVLSMFTLNVFHPGFLL